jgi:Fe2+ or Zn2+ uptake regulation protein
MLENKSNRVVAAYLFLFATCLIIVNVTCGKVIECEVCETVINKLRKQLPDDAKPEEIELQFKEFCKTATGREEKFVSVLITLF